MGNIFEKNRSALSRDSERAELRSFFAKAKAGDPKAARQVATLLYHSSYATHTTYWRVDGAEHVAEVADTAHAERGFRILPDRRKQATDLLVAETLLVKVTDNLLRHGHPSAGRPFDHARDNPGCSA